ncbi:extracellular solute-binding protein [Paenibacillus hemerocallicola]|uniref:Extracellular solute-binding protein n=1 Tax=Paenibacillus hemerocallicola TaxID=1172614 RepID=A0A5C4SXT5_9BACL|nr:extracellular solute-binding protein [Paenibacillus hemerocallicola]TNJ56228.1 extracellular solute-binding protein [Paenibacillus hemerocallicola]
MKHSKLLASLMTVSLTLGACGGETPGGSGGDAGPVESSASIEQKPATLTFLQANLSEELFNQRYGDPLRKRFPNFTIEYLPTTYANYADTIASAASIDIVFASAQGMYGNLQAYKLESDIRDLVGKYKFDLTRFPASTLKAQNPSGDGAIYGFPLNVGVLVFLYNKDLFDKFGVAYPMDSMTWDRLFELARSMTRNEGGRQYQGLSMAFEHVAGWNQKSASYFDAQTGKARLYQDDVKDVLLNAARFWQIAGNAPPDNKYSLAPIRNWFLKDQTTAMYIDADGLIRLTADALTNWDIAKMPVFPGLEDVGPAPNTNYAFIAQTSKNRDAAFQALSYLVSEEYQQWAAEHLGLLPALANAEPLIGNFGGQIPNFTNKNVQALLFPKTAVIQNSHRHYGIAAGEMSNALNDYLAGKDVNSALREAAERVDKRVAEAVSGAK